MQDHKSHILAYILENIWMKTASKLQRILGEFVFNSNGSGIPELLMVIKNSKG